MAETGRLVTALRNRDEPLLRSLLAKGVNPSDCVFTWPLLLHAIRENNPHFVRILLEAGASVESKDGYDRNAIEIACLKLCSLETIRLLVEFGAKFAHDAFRAAVEGDLTYFDNKSSEDIKELLSLRDGAGYSILHYAAVHSQKEFIEMLNVTIDDMSVESDNELHENALMLVVYAGTSDMLDYLVSTFQMDPNSAKGCKDGTTPLLYAAYSGSIHMVEHLVNKYGAVVRGHIDSYGQTPLLNAAYTGRKELYDHLVAKYYSDGNHREDKNKVGKSALLLTVLDNNLDMFKHLIEIHGFDPVTDRDKNGYSALLLSAWYGHIEILDHIVDNFNGDLLHDEDVGKRTCTINSIRNNKLHMLKHLVEVRKVDIFSIVDSDNGNALINACRNGSVDVFEYLIKLSGNRDELIKKKSISNTNDNVHSDGDLADRDDDNKPDTSSSSEIDATSSVDDIPEVGLESQSETKHKNRFDMHVDRDKDEYSCLLTAVWFGNVDVINHLIDVYGVAFKEDRDKNGHGPLMLAVLGKQMKVMDLLINKYGLKLHDAADKSGNTPLMIAAARGNQAMLIRMIEEYQCDPVKDRNDRQLSCVLYAVMFKRKEMLDLLVEKYHCDVNQCTSDSEYVLHFAIDEGHMEIFDYLVSKYNCKYQMVMKTAADGETPFLRAIRCGSLPMVEYLINEYNVDLCSEKDNKGNCSLLVASRYGKKNLIDHFMKKYNYPIGSALNNNGENAWEVAKLRSLYSTAEYIMSYYGYLMKGFNCICIENLTLWQNDTLCIPVSNENIENSHNSDDNDYIVTLAAAHGIEPCIICYEVFDPSNDVRHLPTIKCNTCSVCVHSYCYYKCKSHSQRSREVCVMCQQQIS